jgi:hypothetical protein
MREIECPHCGENFKLDETGYADILKQVRDEAFDEELHERMELAEREKKGAVEIAEAKITRELIEVAYKKDAEIERLKEELKSSAELVHAKVTGDMKYEAVKKNAEIERLKAELKTADIAK